MICQPNTENKIFPFLVIDNFYNEEEQKLIWDELESLQEHLKPNHEGIAKDQEGQQIANLSRVPLDERYEGCREKSAILSCYSKIVSEEVRQAYRKTTPSWRTFEHTNNDSTVLNYYENCTSYKEHFDMFMHSCLVWFYKTPKRFKGGDLFFKQSGTVVECIHNRMVLFPSYYLHEVDEVTLDNPYTDRGYGRYSIAHFYTKNN